jgi:chromosome segregation ATPase
MSEKLDAPPASLVSEERLRELLEGFEHELAESMHQRPQWQKWPRDAVAIVGELLAARTRIAELEAENASVTGELDAAVSKVAELEAEVRAGQLMRTGLKTLHDAAIEDARRLREQLTRAAAALRSAEAWVYGHEMRGDLLRVANECDAATLSRAPAVNVAEQIESAHQRLADTPDGLRGAFARAVKAEEKQS